MDTKTKYPYVAHGRAASILACELRGETHESLACHAANLLVQRDDLATALEEVCAIYDSTDEGYRDPFARLTDMVREARAALAKVRP